MVKLLHLQVEEVKAKLLTAPLDAVVKLQGEAASYKSMIAMLIGQTNIERIEG